MLPAIGFVTVKFVKVPTDVKDELTTVLFKVVPDNVPASAVTVISEEPSNAMPLMFFVAANLVAVAANVAVLALPDRGPENPVAVIVPALKSPLASRATIALAVLAFVAVVAELLTLFAVAIVANLESAMAAEVEISAFIISPSAILALVTASAANFDVVMALVLIDGKAAVPSKSPAN